MGKEGGKVLPELAGQSDDALWTLVQKTGGPKIETAFGATLKETKRGLGKAIRFNVPALGPERMTLEQAWEGYKVAAPEAKSAIRGQIVAAIRAINPKAAGAFEEGLTRRAAGYAYLGALRRALDPSGKVDPRKLQQYLNLHAKQLQTFAGRLWPELEAALLGPGRRAPVELAAKPAVTRLFGRAIQAPPTIQKVAEAVAPVTGHPLMRSLVDTAMATTPLGILSLLALTEAPGAIRGMLPWATQAAK